MSDETTNKHSNLLELLRRLVEKVPYLTELEHEETSDLLRKVESDLGVENVVPPATVGANQTPAPPPVVDPGPVAEPVPAAEQVPPPVSPEVVGAPEVDNALAGTDPTAPPA